MQCRILNFLKQMEKFILLDKKDYYQYLIVSARIHGIGIICWRYSRN